MRRQLQLARGEVVYVWRYEHATLSTFACRAGPFSCRLTLAKLEKKITHLKGVGRVS